MILNLHVYTYTQCILVYCTFGIYRALRLSDPRTTGPSDCRTFGLLGPWSVGTLGLMGGHRWILCTNHCFPRGRTAGKLNFPVYLNITFTYWFWCDLSCLSWKSSKKIIWFRSMTKPTKWPARQIKRRSTWASVQSDQSSLSAWRKLGSLATHWMHNEDWSDCADAQADLSLRWAHMLLSWFCRAFAHYLPSFAKWTFLVLRIGRVHLKF